MDIRELVRALLSFDALAARQWVSDALHGKLDWAHIARPAGLNQVEMAVAAGVVEMLAQRNGQDPPAWTRGVPPLKNPIFLLRAAASMPRLRQLCRQEGPEPLRGRGILVPPEFLTVA